MSVQRFTDTTASDLLDAVRGIAAFLVLLEHWRQAFFVDFSSIVSLRPFLAPLYVLSGAGHQAVIIFFVLSGYLISGTIFRAFQRHEWSWRRYTIHRLARLWVVLIPALFLGALWDNLGIHFHYAPNLYSGANYNHITLDVTRSLSLYDFLGNAAFLQTIVVPTFGSNGPLWSLANEFWYYVLFPLGACVVARIAKTPIHVMLCAAAFCVIAASLPKGILLLFPIWLFGALLHALPSPPTTLRFRGLTAFVYAILFFGVAMLDHRGWFGQGVLGDSFLGIATIGFIWVLLGAKQRSQKTLPNQMGRHLARLSYTLYATHMPFLIFMVALLAHDSRSIPTAGNALLALGILILLLAYAWLVAMVTEFKTDRVRAWAENKVIGVSGATEPT
jgi:peptidoglycan/LPS O-acetylase OafA/YrhL